MGEIQSCEKIAYQKAVSMVTSNFTDKDLLHQIVARSILGSHQVWWRYLVY